MLWQLRDKRLPIKSSVRLSGSHPFYQAVRRTMDNDRPSDFPSIFTENIFCLSESHGYIGSKAARKRKQTRNTRCGLPGAVCWILYRYGRNPSDVFQSGSSAQLGVTSWGSGTGVCETVSPHSIICVSSVLSVIGRVFRLQRYVEVATLALTQRVFHTSPDDEIISILLFA